MVPEFTAPCAVPYVSAAEFIMHCAYWFDNADYAINAV
jgi:hypothetical protein